ncbi:MAG: alpha-mannosidase, partial [Clostridia bacterium]|nr:alpha-mannosidase [Clostridia bacterium]
MKKTYLIGNAHIDPAWLWEWEEGYSEVWATFRSALDRMNEYPDYKFTSACAIYYKWIEDSDPDMFKEIVARVKEGRWCITGGWLLQPDCNIPSGESFARHALISQRYFKEKFGKTAITGYNVDSFGHNGNIPMLLRNSGMKNYVFMRPQEHEKDLPARLFNWQSKDKSTVTAYRIPLYYNIWEDFGHFYQVANLDDAPALMAFYGVGNHGGGATKYILDKINAELPDNFFYSTPDEYFSDMEKEEK